MVGENVCNFHLYKIWSQKAIRRSA